MSAFGLSNSGVYEDVMKMCRRLGELLRQELERQRKMKMEGHTVYLEYVQRGQDAKVSKQVTSIENVSR